MATDLNIYGKTLRTYQGNGLLEFSDGSLISVSYQTAQLTDGRVLLWCHAPLNDAAQLFAQSDDVIGFQGTAREGLILRADKPARELGYLPPAPASDTPTVMATFELRDLLVDVPPGAPQYVSHFVFGLTNILFEGNTLEKWQMGELTREELALPFCIGNERIVLRRRLNYREAADRLRTLRFPEVTAEAVIPAEGGIENATRAVEDLCWLLSVARGTKVNWVYVDALNGDGKLVHTHHANRITKRYSPLSVIDPRDRDDTGRFVERAHPRFAEIKDQFELCRGTIDAYLDAKAEADFLEVRAAKLAVCLERLKHYFAVGENAEYILDEGLFAGKDEELREGLRKLLKDTFQNRINRNQIAAMAAHLGGMNRRSFKSIVRRLCKRIDLKLSDEDLQTFVRARNALVHRGRFACTLPKADDQTNAHVFSSPVDEWLFMVNVLDRVFLRLLGYDGMYLNRAKWPGVKELLR